MLCRSAAVPGLDFQEAQQDPGLLNLGEDAEKRFARLSP